jgi:hypothetical protein
MLPRYCTFLQRGITSNKSSVIATARPFALQNFFPGEILLLVWMIHCNQNLLPNKLHFLFATPISDLSANSKNGSRTYQSTEATETGQAGQADQSKGFGGH